jgi:hypothetical protein
MGIRVTSWLLLLLLICADQKLRRVMGGVRRGLAGKRNGQEIQGG